MDTSSSHGGSSFHRFEPRKVILFICILALLCSSAVASLAFERLPHLEDEVAYLFQAKTIALGRLTVPTPDEPESFWTPFVLDLHGQRFGKYPPGWPAVLALGVLAGTPWLVNPILAAVALYLLYRLGRSLYDARTGLLAAALALASPLFLVLSGSYLSHLASLVWLLLFTLWFVWAAQGRGWQYALGAGAALGLAFLTRSLTAVAFCTPFAVYALLQVVRRRQAHWAHYFLVALSALALGAMLPVYQWAVTGDPWLNPYVLWWPYDRLGFGPGKGAMPGGHSLHYAWINLKQDLSRTATDALGWTAASWLPLVPGLAMHRRRARDWGLLTPLCCVVIAYLFYWIGSPSRLWGPRYYFEGLGGWWLVSAVGLLKVWDWIRSRRGRMRTVAAAGMILVVAISPGLNIPGRMQEAHGFYGITRAQLKPITEAGIQHALVIVYAERWLEYGAMLGTMSPMLDDSIVYARGSSPEQDTAVIEQFPDRSVYYLHQGQLQSGPP